MMRGRRSLAPRPVPPAAVLVVALAATCAAGPAAAETLRFEAEINFATHNAGGASIVLVACEHASGGFALQGMDVAGDCVDFLIYPTAPVCLADSIRAAAPVEGSWRYRLQILPQDGGTPLVDVPHRAIQGRGMG